MNLLKYFLPLAAALVLAAGSAQANLTISQTFSAGGAIPDGNPVPTRFAGTFAQPGFANPVLFITVSLNITGGYNGDLYAYLVAPNGKTVVLMNQPGSDLFGAAGAGMNITLTDATTGSDYHGSIQNPGDGNLTGSFNAAGSLSTFNGSAANGTWSLYFADLSSGGGTSTLNSWSLGITVVPEPVLMSLGIFAVMLAALAGLKLFWKEHERGERDEDPDA